MLHRYNEYVFVHDYGHAKLYKGDHLIFKGNAWSGILQFLTETNNAPEVRQMFRSQLEQREKPRHTNSEMLSKKT